MDEARRQAIQQELAGQQFQLGEAKKQAGQKDFLATLDFNKYKTPDRPFPLTDAGPAQAFDPNQQWAAQPDVVRQQVLAEAAKRFVSPEQVAGAYNARVGVNTGRPVLPITPPGMRLGELDAGPAKYIPDYSAQMTGGNPQGPTGNPGQPGDLNIHWQEGPGGSNLGWYTNPRTGMPEFVHPSIVGSDRKLTSQEAGRVGSFERAKQDAQHLADLFNNVSSSERGPVAGRVWQGPLNFYSEDKSRIEGVKALMLANIGRGLGSESGAFTDADARRYDKVMPTLYDTPGQANAKIQELLGMIERDRSALMSTLQMSGRDLSKFKPLSATNVSTSMSNGGGGGGSKSKEQIRELYRQGLITKEEARKQLSGLIPQQ